MTGVFVRKSIRISLVSLTKPTSHLIRLTWIALVSTVVLVNLCLDIHLHVFVWLIWRCEIHGVYLLDSGSLITRCLASDSSEERARTHTHARMYRPVHARADASGFVALCVNHILTRLHSKIWCTVKIYWSYVKVLINRRDNYRSVYPTQSFGRLRDLEITIPRATWIQISINCCPFLSPARFPLISVRFSSFKLVNPDEIY